MTRSARAPRAVIVDDDVQRQMRLRMSPSLAVLNPVTLAWGVQVLPLVRLLAPEVIVASIPREANQLTRLIQPSSGGHSPMVVLIAPEVRAHERQDFEARGMTIVANDAQACEALRRFHVRAGHPIDVTPTSLVLHLGAVTVDLARGEVIREGERAVLAPRERALLTLLAQRSGQIVSRDEILRDVWAGRPTASRVVDRQVVALRKRLERDPRRPKYLLTVFARGYRLAI